MLMRRLVQKRLGHYLIQNTTFVASCDADRAQIESGLQMSDSTIIRQRQSNKITAYISMSFGSYTCPFVLSNQFQYKITRWKLSNPSDTMRAKCRLKGHFLQKRLQMTSRLQSIDSSQKTEEATTMNENEITKLKLKGYLMHGLSQPKLCFKQ